MRGRPMALTPLRLVQGSLATPAQNRAYSANNRKSRLAQECVVADAVRIEPVSTSKFPDNRENNREF
jgi:hypothetical protein